jgi:hypothetical protein
MSRIAASTAFAVALSACTAAPQAPALVKDPADPAAATPAPVYDSAFAGYQPYREPALADWRALNEEVGTVGGHAGIFRSAGPAGRSVEKPNAAGGKPPAAPAHH